MAEIFPNDLADFSEIYGINASEPWRIFRIMSEFIDSFEVYPSS